jgi:methylated-DNA-protein-cysteine methyltransferase-like protein
MADDALSPTNGQVASLKAQVFALVRACPAGKVTTYGWISKALGYPRGARMIGWIMNETDEGVPAQRVINSKGELSGSWAFGQKGRMRKLLEAEGVTFSADERVDLKRYGWDPSRDLSDEERQRILEAASTQSAAVSPRLLQLLRLDPASPLRTPPVP